MAGWGRGRRSMLLVSGGSLRSRLLSAAAQATVRHNAHGGVSVKVPQDQMSSVVAHRDGDGQLVIEHADATGTTQSEGLPHD